MLTKAVMEKLDDLTRLLEESGLRKGMEMMDQIACLLLLRDLERRTDGAAGEIGRASW